MPSSVPVIDLGPWFGGDEAARAAVGRPGRRRAAERRLLPDQRSRRARRPARARSGRRPGRSSRCRPEVKQRYAVTVGGRGWLPPGVEANGYAEGTQTPPDLKESFAVGADQPTGDPDVDGYWFQPNVYPAEVPELEPAVVAYLARMRDLADELLRAVRSRAGPGT